VVGSSTPDANPDNNTATAPTVVVGSADMAISKTGPDGPVVAGETLTYTIVITNNGPSLAEDVDVKDFVPAGMNLVNATISSTGGQCMAGLCQLGDVDAGEVQTITVVTVVGTDVPAGTLLENTAQVFTDSTDPNPGNNVDSWTNPVGSRALISVQKRDLNDPIGPENLLFYVIDVTNAGPSDAQNVIVTDTLDSRTTYASDTDSCVQGPTGTLTCSLGTVTAGTTESFILTVRVDSGLVSGTVLLNNVTVTTTTPVDASSTLTDTEETTVNAISGGATDLQVVKSATPAIAGGVMTYTIVATNHGPSPATGVEVLDTLPAQVTLIDVTSSQGLCDRSIFCLLGGLAAGKTATITVTVAVPANSQPNTTLINRVFVQGNEPDPTPGNNSDQVISPVELRADLSMSKVSSVASVIAGTDLTYTLVVTNAGPSVAQNVVITDILPAGVTYLSATPAAVGSTSPLTWTLGNLAAGSTATVSLRVRVGPSVTGTIANSAVAASDTPDPAPVDNGAVTPPVTVTPEANLSFSKRASASTVAAGQGLTYTLVLTNAGPSTATNVAVTDTLPAGVTLNRAIPTQSSGPNPLVWRVGSVVPNTVVTFTVVVTVNANAATGSLVNTALAGSDTTDPVGGDTGDLVDVNIVNEADVAVTKSDSTDPLLAGELLTYTLVVTNNGPSLARSVRVTDTLPAGVVFQSAVPTQSSGPNPLVWSLGDLPPSAVRILTVVVRVAQSAAIGTITNTVVGGTITPDPVIGNNSDDEPTLIVKPILTLDKRSTDINGGALEPRDLLRYTLVLTNSGNTAATGTVVTDSIPANTTYVPGSATTSQGTISGPNPLVWTLGSVAPKAVITMSFVVSVHVVTNGTTLYNAATVDAVETQPVVADDTTTPISTTTGVAVEKVILSATPAYLTERITYSIRITNTGNTVLTKVPLTDIYERPYLTYANAVPTPDRVIPNATATTGNLVWDDITTYFGDLQPGQMVSLTVEMTATAVTPSNNPASNSAAVSGVVDELGQTPPGAGDDGAVDVIILPNLGMVKLLATPGVISIGDEVTFTIEITNLGSTVIVILPLQDNYNPAFLGFIEAIPAHDAYVPGQINWNDLTPFFGDLLPKKSITVTVVFTAVQATSGTTNTATINNAVDNFGNLAGALSLAPVPVQQPTYVRLMNFTATAEGADVRLAWETSTEIDNLGFHLFRGTTDRFEDAVRINEQMIPGQGRTTGASYTYVDSNVEAGAYTYWIVDVPIAGPQTVAASAQATVVHVTHRIYLPLVAR
ncbi:MAG: DUF11 domain-containing protein, partial [Caldilineaceae bacterium]|nr:DUF11 domain-containing protein [Caldilineaceae bacterium]